MGKRLGRVLTGLVVGLSTAEKPWRRADTRLRVAEALQARHQVATRYGPLTFVTTHSQALEYPRRFTTREPETFAWIDGFDTPCRFWDIGANIGIFSIYPGLRRDVEVSAFRTRRGKLCGALRQHRGQPVRGWGAGLLRRLSERTALGRLHLSGANPGSVFNAFESTRDCFGNEIAVVSRQAMVGFSVDGFRGLFGLPAPNYMKIDVDSVEEQILAGARETLRDPELRSVLIELEAAATARNDRLKEMLEAAGLNLVKRSASRQGDVVNGIFARRAVPAVAEPVADSRRV